MRTEDHASTQELSADEAAATAGGSPLSYGIGYAIGYLARLIRDADPFDGNYYGVGA